MATDAALAAAASTPALASAQGDSVGPNCSAPGFFDPDWLDDVVWVAQRVNKHSLTNRWLVVDETRCFELLMKERKAVTTQQCRIVVKGAPHLPLQLSCGTSVQFLYPTWQYLKLIEASGAVPAVPASRYRDVEEWMLNHIREFNESRLADAHGHAHAARPVPGSSPVLAAVPAPLPSGGGSDSALSSPALTPRGPHGQPDAPPAVRSGDGAASPQTAAAAAGRGPGVRSRLRDFFQRKAKPAADGPAPTGTGSGGTSPSKALALPPGDAELEAHTAAATASGTLLPRAVSPAITPEPSVTPPLPVVNHSTHAASAKPSKRAAVADFLRRKLRSSHTAEGAAAALVDSDSESDEPHDVDLAALPNPPEAESLATFRLSLDAVRRMWRELRDDGSHATFDRLYRRRRAATKWEYQHREQIQETIKNNRTVTAMVVVGAYTTLMHLVPFDVFLLLLLLLELLTYYVWTHYRDLAFDMGRRAARTRVDRVKDWFFFAVTRRKARPAGADDAGGKHASTPAAAPATATAGGVTPVTGATTPKGQPAPLSQASLH